MQSCAFRWRGGIRGCSAALHMEVTKGVLPPGAQQEASVLCKCVWSVKACCHSGFHVALKVSLQEVTWWISTWLYLSRQRKRHSSCIVSNVRASLWLWPVEVQDYALPTLATLYFKAAVINIFILRMDEMNMFNVKGWSLVMMKPQNYNSMFKAIQGFADLSNIDVDYPLGWSDLTWENDTVHKHHFNLYPQDCPGLRGVLCASVHPRSLSLRFFPFVEKHFLHPICSWCAASVTNRSDKL